MFGGGGSNKLDDLLINLKMNSKCLEREANKCLKEEKAQRLRVKKALSEGNTEVAQVYAENAIRKKNEYLNYLKLASRLDGTAARVKSAANMQKMSKAMGGVVKGLDQAMKTMDLVKVEKVMLEFEKNCTDLEVWDRSVTGALDTATSTTTPADQVSALINQVAEENGLAITGQVSAVPNSDINSRQQLEDSENDDLTRRLAELRQA